MLDKYSVELHIIECTFLELIHNTDLDLIKITFTRFDVGDTKGHIIPFIENRFPLRHKWMFCI